MKKIVILAAIAIGLSSCCTTRESELISAYEAYYKASEALLDSIDRHYSIADAFDQPEYYEAWAKLDSLRR